ncbi:MAG: GH3 auxin-responsive promoter family protein [Nanoarchaeota archaeon]|nr:GH3 auxin-responsive promoter family protein [Nanoarchaeota archaeon]
MKLERLKKFLGSKKGKEFLSKHQQFFLRDMVTNADEFLELAKDPLKSQENYLLGLIQKNKDTDFGKEHHFNEIRNIQEFQKNIPIRDYEDLRPYIEQVINGNTNALFPKRPLMFLKTSGTVDKPKYIPITRQTKQENRDSFQTWTYHTILDHPNLAGGTTVIISSASKEGKIGKYSFGSYSGWMRDNQPFLNKLFYAIPAKIYEIEDENLRYYALIRASIEQNITMINTANSSTILNLIRKADERKENLIRDVREGTISFENIDEKDQKRLRKLRFKPNPNRAQELENIVNETGHLLPKDYWENLVVIGCWKGGSQSIFYSQFDKYFGKVPVRDLGILASEGRITIPITDKGNSGILDIGHTFFEFIPDNEINKQNPQVLTADQLEKDKAYFLLMTTSGGLYRYNINDRIKVTGFRDNTPEICFLDKGKHFSSITGEKLTEHQVVSAMRNLKTDISEFILHPAMNGENNLPYYQLLIEGSELKGLDMNKLQTEYDKELERVNIEYESKRKTRIDPVRVKRVPNGTFAKIKAEVLHRGKISHDSQYKHQFLNPRINYDKELNLGIITD